MDESALTEIRPHRESRVIVARLSYALGEGWNSRSNPVAAGRTPVHGQPVFTVARPDGRQVWVDFAHPPNDTVQVIDVPALEIAHEFRPGKAVMHLEVTPRGERVWIWLRDEDRVEVYDTASFARLAALPVAKSSGLKRA